MRHRTHLPTRVKNKARRVLAGLGLRGECVWPGVRNDLFVAHESIYWFFARYAKGLRVFDGGCGTGYGSKLLADAGAASVRGFDIDPRNVRYAERHYAAPAVTFAVADCQDLRLPAQGLDLVVSSNVLEHLRAPGRFLDAVKGGLTREGRVVLAMPPITSEAQLAENEAIPFHVSNLTVDEWISLFEDRGWKVDLFRHAYRAGSEKLDFTSPFPSSIQPDGFNFPRSTRDELYSGPTLGAIYSLTLR